jgi:hypothetical protein
MLVKSHALADWTLSSIRTGLLFWRAGIVVTAFENFLIVIIEPRVSPAFLARAHVRPVG